MGRLTFLARLFTEPRNVSNDDDPANEDIRLAALQAASEPLVVASLGGKVGVISKRGILHFESSETLGAEIIEVTWLPAVSTEHFRFWMNRSSLKEIGEILRKAPKTTMTAILSH